VSLKAAGKHGSIVGDIINDQETLSSAQRQAFCAACDLSN
jgi:hypothetical protein